MRVFLDTNVLIAAFISHGACAEILEYCVVRHDLVGSEYLLEELRRTLAGKFRMGERDSGAAEALLRGRMVLVKAPALPKPLSRDPKDDPILAAAMAGRCACLVTGDKDLLVLKQAGRMPILSPQQFWRFEAEGFQAGR